jgi:hypothetical protein
MTLIYLLGQDVGLTVLVTDNDGAPVVGSSSVAVTVTDPAGGITSPVVSEAGSGAYTAVVPSVSTAGVWLYRWTAPDFAFEGQFTVRPAGIESIVDLPSVKAHLNIPENDLRADDELMGYIYAAGDLARDVCGPFLPEQHTQFFDGGVSTISPDWLPLATVQSVTEYYGLSAFPLTEQQLGSAMNAFAFTVDLSTGTITRRAMGGEAAIFAAGYRNVKVVYTAGSRPVPYTVRLGALELIRHLWQMTQQPGRPSFSGAGIDGGENMVHTGYALPNRVIELWAPYKRPPGVA